MVVTRGQKRKDDEEEKKTPSRKNSKKSLNSSQSETSTIKAKSSESNMEVDENFASQGDGLIADETMHMDEDTKKDYLENIEIQNLVVADILNHCRLIQKSIDIREYRSIGRIVRELNTIRKKLTVSILNLAINTFVDKDSCPLNKFLPRSKIQNLVKFPENMQDRKMQYLPECDVYCHLLLVLWLLDNKDNRSEAIGDGIEAANALVDRLSKWHERRGMDFFEAKAYFFQAQMLSTAGIKLQSLTGFWHLRIRTAILRSNVHSQASLYNLLLRVYLSNQQYEQAQKFMQKTDFPKNADNNQWSRYFYYTGRIKAVQLEYSNARQRLVQALRKSPTNETTAVGFKQTVSKLLTTVQLLLGEIPDREIFFKKTLQNSLKPYYELTQSVRSGDLGKFSESVSNFSENFETDKNLRLVMRLRHNVIKTGIRQIATSYSKISLTELGQKLNLDNADDAEFIVAKAIKDGVIEAEIDHINKWMISYDSDNIYSTKDPQDIFQKRIDFCFDVHKQSVLSMRYPDKQNRLDGLLNAEKMRLRDQVETELMAKELAEETDDEDDEDYEM